jgi:hypothetical protein
MYTVYTLAGPLEANVKASGDFGSVENCGEQNDIQNKANVDPVISTIDMGIPLLVPVDVPTTLRPTHYLVPSSEFLVVENARFEIEKKKQSLVKTEKTENPENPENPEKNTPNDANDDIPDLPTQEITIDLTKAHYGIPTIINKKISCQLLWLELSQFLLKKKPFPEKIIQKIQEKDNCNNPTIDSMNQYIDKCYNYIIQSSYYATISNPGVPHAIFFIDDSEQQLPAEIQICNFLNTKWDLISYIFPVLGFSFVSHPEFPSQINVEFVRSGIGTEVGERKDKVDGKSTKIGEQIRPKYLLETIVIERGCGITQSCGTGCVATALAAIFTNRIRHPLLALVQHEDEQNLEKNCEKNSHEKRIGNSISKKVLDIIPIEPIIDIRMPGGDLRVEFAFSNQKESEQSFVLVEIQIEKENLEQNDRKSDEEDNLGEEKNKKIINDAGVIIPDLFDRTQKQIGIQFVNAFMTGTSCYIQDGELELYPPIEF